MNEKADTPSAAAAIPREVVPPPEPRIAYPEPHLSATETTSLVRGKTFLSTDLSGNVMPPGHPNVGLFSEDTRFLSYWQLQINGHPAVVLSANTSDAHATHIEMTAKGSVPGDGLDLPVNTVYIRREQVLENRVFHDVLHLHNYYGKSVRLSISISFGADFVDIFQVRGILRGKAGRYYAPVYSTAGCLLLYEGLDQKVRSTSFRFDPAPARLMENTASWEIELEPLENFLIECTIVPQTTQQEAHAPLDEFSRAEPVADDHKWEDALETMGEDLFAWQAGCSSFRSDNDIFDAMLGTSTRDFYALQIRHPYGTAIAAGIPWFATLFGRDSLIASFETLLLNPDLAKGTLKVLAMHQGTVFSDDRDEEPGKILHEFREGEMTNTGEVAFGRNYGSVDATPLFIILLSEYLRWTGDLEFLRVMETHLWGAVEWLLRYADLDGDGLIEYARKSPKGLFNQGWKDSGDAIAHADGSIAQPPIALIEVQGYAADAFMRAAELFTILGVVDKPAFLTKASLQLRERLQSAFWLPNAGIYAMALDRDKRPLNVRASNPGHLLFANAIDKAHAKLVATALMARDLNCGWGIRTLSQGQKTFNPMSYHSGSVWPHDNALAAYGMARYGFHAECSSLCTSLYEAGLHFRDYRLPELFCGIQRGRGNDPVHYPVSCSPQAWASGAMFLILTGLLGIQPDALNHEVKVVNPQLPQFLTQLAIHKLRIGNSRIWLDFSRHDGRTFCNVTRLEGEPVSVSVIYR